MVTFRTPVRGCALELAPWGLPSYAGSTVVQPSCSPKSTAQSDAIAPDVLLYYSAVLRFEEALGTRPKARRPAVELFSEANLVEPVGGQDYAKLAYAGAEEFLVERQGERQVEVGAEWTGFFEDWLAERYRRDHDDDDGYAHFVAYPTVHLPRGELAGVLRFPVDLAWEAKGQPFSIPTPAHRKSRELPPPPDRACLRQTSNDSEQALPFFIDTKLLRDTLRVEPERIDEAISKLRQRETLTGRDMVEETVALIGGQASLEGAILPLEAAPTSPDEAARLLRRLHEVITVRLRQVGSRARAYPVALIIRSDPTRATWHLQRDLKAALGLWSGGRLKESPLRPYLTGRPGASGLATCWGRFRGGPGLTDRQREAASLALGSTLSSVQGPPGTGKTTLALNLLAHTLVQKVTALASGRTMGRTIAVVTSTNNRAVDNVVDPLGDVAPILTAPALHLPIEGSQERLAGSWMNTAEVEATVSLVCHLLDCGIAPGDIGVVTPYRGQLERLWRAFRQAGVSLERLPAEVLEGDSEVPGSRLPQGLAIGTVHRFQGGQRSIIVFSTTVTRFGSLPFVDARVNLVNVAVSRAKDHLIVIGHTPTLRCGHNTRLLVESAVVLELPCPRPLRARPESLLDG